MSSTRKTLEISGPTYSLPEAAAGAAVAEAAEAAPEVAAEVAAAEAAAEDAAAVAAAEAAVCRGALAASARSDYQPTLTLSIMAGFDKVDPGHACLRC